MEHRASTAIFHCLLSSACTLAVSHVRLDAPSSLCRLLHHVCFRCPCFVFPCGFHSSVWLVMFEGSLRRVWQSHHHFLPLVWMTLGSSFTLVHKMVFGTTYVEALKMEDLPETFVNEDLDLLGDVSRFLSHIAIKYCFDI